MFYKFYKTIHNHYLKFFKFFYFLRYLFPIFLAAIIFYILIPKFLNYEKKVAEIKNFLSENYQLELNDYSSINYNILPAPNISLNNVNFTLKKESTYLKAEKIYIFLKLNNIYNEKIVSKKVFINKNKMDIEIEAIARLIDHFKNISSKLKIKDLDLDLIKDSGSILKIQDIEFSNYGYKKDKLKGIIFEKKFQIYFDKEKNDFKFKILESGVKANFKIYDYETNQPINGVSKISILDNYFKLNYLINKKQIIVDKSKFRNKDLSASFKNLIRLKPYFEMNLDVKIERINSRIFNKLDLEKILQQKNIVKKINGVNKIYFKEKNIFQNNLIKEYSTQILLENGRMSELSEMKLPGTLVKCNTESLLIEEYPRLYFQCNLNILDLREFNKFFSISNKLIQKPINLYLKGSINVLRKKINFENIEINQINYSASEEDKIYFKKNFEAILLTEGIFNIFKKQKIKSFVDGIF